MNIHNGYNGRDGNRLSAMGTPNGSSQGKKRKIHNGYKSSVPLWIDVFSISKFLHCSKQNLSKLNRLFLPLQWFPVSVQIDKLARIPKLSLLIMDGLRIKGPLSSARPESHGVKS